MITAIILVLLGFLLVFIEFYLPGGLMGIVGGVLILGGLVLFAVDSNSPLASLAFVVTTVVLFVLLIKYTLWKIQHTSSEYSVYSDQSQEGYYASKNFKDAVGKTATATTDLRPGGFIELDGQRLQAISRSGYITKGSEVEIIANEEESLIVKIKR